MSGTMKRCIKSREVYHPERDLIRGQTLCVSRSRRSDVLATKLKTIDDFGYEYPQVFANCTRFRKAGRQFSPAFVGCTSVLSLKPAAENGSKSQAKFFVNGQLNVFRFPEV